MTMPWHMVSDLKTNILRKEHWRNQKVYRNRLCINDTKTELIFTYKKPITSDIVSVQVGDTEVQTNKDHVKLLGTILDKKLTLNAHVQARAKSALYNINLIKMSGIYSQ